MDLATVWSYAVPLYSGTSGSLPLAQLVEALCTSPPKISWKSAKFWHPGMSNPGWKELAELPALWSRVVLRRSPRPLPAIAGVAREASGAAAANRVWNWATENGRSGRAATEALATMLGSRELPWDTVLWTAGFGSKWLGFQGLSTVAVAMRPVVRDLLERIAQRADCQHVAVAPPLPLPSSGRPVETFNAREKREKAAGAALALAKFRASSRGASSSTTTDEVHSSTQEHGEALNSDETQWCYGDGAGASRGTAGTSAIVAMLQKGELSPRTRVWTVGRGLQWVDAAAIPTFAKALPPKQTTTEQMVSSSASASVSASASASYVVPSPSRRGARPPSPTQQRQKEDAPPAAARRLFNGGGGGGGGSGRSDQLAPPRVAVRPNEDALERRVLALTTTARFDEFGARWKRNAGVPQQQQQQQQQSASAVNVNLTSGLTLKRCCGLTRSLRLQLDTGLALDSGEYPSDGCVASLAVVCTLAYDAEEKDNALSWLNAPIELALAREIAQRAVLETLSTVQVLPSKAGMKLELDLMSKVRRPHTLVSMRVGPLTPAPALHSLFCEHVQLMFDALVDEYGARQY